MFASKQASLTLWTKSVISRFVTMFSRAIYCSWILVGFKHKMLQTIGPFIIINDLKLRYWLWLLKLKPESPHRNNVIYFMLRGFMKSCLLIIYFVHCLSGLFFTRHITRSSELKNVYHIHPDFKASRSTLELVLYFWVRLVDHF